MILKEKSLVADFKALAAKMEAPTVVEFGAKRSRPDFSTLHKDWVPHASTFLGSDFQYGLDVDVVADLQYLPFSEEVFDIMLSCSVFEHIERPWIAAKEMARCLKPGGLIFVQTHQSFPLHGYPQDYFRFSVEALSLLFIDAGLTVIDAAYEYPCQIVSAQDPDGKDHPAFLSTCLIARKAE